jgi:hypothetical protein
METPRCKDTPVVCRRLRAKGAWVPYGEPVTWEAGYIPTASFWCLGTADVIGPDDGFVHPHVCVNGRACFCDQRPRMADQ